MTLTFIPRKYFPEIAFIIIFLVDLFLKVLPIAPISVLVFFLLMIRSNYWENTFMCLMFYNTIVGFIANSMGVSGIGGWVLIFGVLLFLYGLISNKVKMQSMNEAVTQFIILMALFAFSALTTTGGDYAFPKLISTFRQGALALVGYVFFFSNFQRFDTRKIGLFHILLAIMLLRLSFIVNMISGPRGILDFSFFRYQTQMFSIDRESEFHIDYQHLGFFCVQGIGFLLISLKRIINYFIYFILAITTLIILYIGSRQAIVTILIMLLVWFFQSRGKGLNQLLILSIVGMCALILIIMTLSDEGGALNSVAESGYVEGGGRGLWLKRGIELFQSSPFVGVGFGRYEIFGLYGSYPHNMFIELLCETGLVGTILAIYLAGRSIIGNWESFMAILYLFMALFFRYMASGGLSTSVILFALVFALPAFIQALKRSGSVID